MTKKQQNKSRVVIWVVLHVMLAIYALGGVCSKFAAQEEFLSFRFCLFYGLLIFLLALYAIGWQQIIKRMPLTQAYANKAVSVVWACIYGVLFFQEKITLGKVCGGLLTIAGVVLFALSDKETDPSDSPTVQTIKPAENLTETAGSTTSVNPKNEHKITPDTFEGAEGTAAMMADNVTDSREGT